MWGILLKLSFILPVVLFLPATLVLASQNSLPGDITYPIKRSLESVILSAASIHPKTRAAFNVDFSRRRYTESLALLKEGRNANESLASLVVQTQSAVVDIKKITNRSEKAKLASDLTKQINDINQNLEKIQQSKTLPSEVPKTTPIPQPKIEEVIPTPTPTITRVITLRPTRVPGVSPIAVPRVTPTPTIRPTQVPTPTLTIDQPDSGETTEEELQEYIDELEKIKDQLVPVLSSAPEALPSPTPTIMPTATPTPTLRPTSTPIPTPTPRRGNGFGLASVEEEILTPTPSPTIVISTPTPTPTPTKKPSNSGFGIASIEEPTPTQTPTPIPTLTPTPTL
ncbi:MAG: DUF5667 domain-containing protein [Candidatus Daviesbacteria bacterium]|nr:DUF5667 domain-containing protein [Candidatus Daviesbacteria bacterium]